MTHILGSIEMHVGFLWETGRKKQVVSEVFSGRIMLK
jgi:hypothetical protein